MRAYEHLHLIYIFTTDFFNMDFLFLRIVHVAEEALHRWAPPLSPPYLHNSHANWAWENVHDAFNIPLYLTINF